MNPKFKGISDQGFSRIARVIKSQTDKDTNKWGEAGTTIPTIRKRLKDADAIWTDEGWEVGYIFLNELKMIRLPLFSIANGYFYCYDNQLTSLEGSPRTVEIDFDCSNNQLVSLEGGPEYVGGSFDCSNNQIISLEGIPDYIGGNFICKNNIGDFTEEDIRNICEVGGEIIIEYHDTMTIPHDDRVKDIEDVQTLYDIGLDLYKE